MRRPGWSRRTTLAGFVALLAGAAVGLNVVATAKGAGIWPDSVTYIQSARNLVASHRFTTPIDARSHVIKPGDFPPLYPMVMAVPGFLGADIVHAARWVQTGFIAVSCVLLGLLLHRFARPPAVVAGVALLLVSSGFVVEIGAFILSDSMFLCLSLLTTLLLVGWLQRPDGEPYDGAARLVVAGLAAGTAVDTRFVGLALVGVVVVAAARLDRRRSPLAVLLAVASSLLPVVAWKVAGNRVGTPVGLGERTLALHPPGRDAALDTLFTAGSWVLPRQLGEHLPRIFSEAAGVVVTGVAVSLFVGVLLGRGPLHWARPEPGPARRDVTLLARLLLLLAALHLAVVVGTVALLDAAVPFDRRILFPVFVCGLVLAVVAADAALVQGPPSRRLAAVGTVLAVVLAANGVGTTIDVAEAHREGLGFASVTFRCSPLVAAVEARRPGVKVYSNAPGAIFLLTGVRAQAITPRRYGNGSGANPGYAAGMRKMHKRVGRGWSIVVFFSSVERPFGPDLPALRDVLDRPALLTTGDGVLFGRASAFDAPLRGDRCRSPAPTSNRAARPG